jgi:conjugal transfer pilus assembly protein TraU
MMRGLRPIFGTFLVVLFAIMLAPRAEAAGPTCNGKFVNPITDVCWSCLFPLSVGGLKIWPSGRPDTKPIRRLAYMRLRRSIPRIGISVGFWEPARLADVTMKPWCFPNLGGMRIAPGFDIGQGYLAGPSMVGGRSQSTAKWHVHWYVYPLLYWMEILTDFVCFEQASFDIAYMTEVDPLWQDDSLTALINPEAIVFANPIAQVACAGDCIAGTVNLPLDQLFWCAGCQGSMYPLNGNMPSSIGHVQSSRLALSRFAYKMHRAGAGLGHDGLGGPVQEVPHADHAQAAIPVSDDQSDPDGERALRLLGDRGFDHAAGCRSRLSRRGRGHGLPGLAQAQLLRAVGGSLSMRLLIFGLLRWPRRIRQHDRLSWPRPSMGSTFRPSRSDRRTFRLMPRRSSIRSRTAVMRFGRRRPMSNDSGMANMQRVAKTDLPKGPAGPVDFDEIVAGRCVERDGRRRARHRSSSRSPACRCRPRRFASN